MKNKPATLELAQLAAQLHPQKGAERESIKQAMTLWTEAERELEQVQHRAEYLRDLIAVIYTATPEDWEKRIEEYPGERSDVDAELLKRVPADKVRQSLFKDKNLSRETRKRLFGGLVLYAKNHGMVPPHFIVREAVKSEPDTSSPYYEKFRPEYKIRNVIWKARQWPDGEESIRVMCQMFETCVDMTLHSVRWAVEVRKRQIAENKTRNVPESLTQSPKQDGDSIQFKAKHRG